MIVRDLLIKLGFKADTAGLDKTDRQIGQLKASTIALGQVMANLAQQGIGAAVTELKAASEASIEFGRGMANVGSIMGGTEADTLKMAETAKALGKEFGVLPKDISAAMYDVVGSLGYTADTVDQVRMAVKLGKAGAASTAEGFAVLSAVTKAYGDTSAKTMEHVGDLASASVRLGVLTMPELAASIQQVTPSASALGVTLEELFNVQSTLSGTTGSAAEVYTQMQSAMTGLLKKTPALEKAFKKTFGGEGIKTAKQAIGKYGLQGTLQKLVGQTDGTQEALVDLFGRVEAVRFVMSVTGNQAKDYADKLKQMGQVSGEVDRTVAKQTTGLGANAFALDKAKAAAEANRIELGDRLAPRYIDLIKLGGQVAKVFGDELGPVFDLTATDIKSLTGDVDGLGLAFKAIKAILLGVAQVIDTVATIIADLSDQIMAMAAGTVQVLRGVGLAAMGDFEGAAKTIGSVGNIADVAKRSSANREAGFMARTQARERAMYGDPGRERMAAASASASDVQGRIGGAFSALQSWAGQSVNTNVGGVTVNVTVPAGTEAAAAARIGDTGARSMMAQFVHGVQRGFPVQGPAQ
jgi:TP901 family phage tail tape measure protein